MAGRYDDLKQLISSAEFGDWVDSQQGIFRFADESREETFKRMLLLCRAVICQECHGRGHDIFSSRAYALCLLCGGTGNLLKLDLRKEG